MLYHIIVTITCYVILSADEGADRQSRSVTSVDDHVFPPATPSDSPPPVNRPLQVTVDKDPEEETREQLVEKFDEEPAQSHVLHCPQRKMICSLHQLYLVHLHE